MRDALDDLYQMMVEQHGKEEVDRALAEAEAQFERAVHRPCAFGRCTESVDPLTNTIFGGFGDPFCGCENLPGWRSKHPAGKPKPGWLGKARGRHGSRVQRSRARRADWRRWTAQERAKWAEHTAAGHTTADGDDG